MSNSVRPHRRQLTRLPHPWDSPGKSTRVGCHFLLQCMKVKSESEVAQSWPKTGEGVVGSVIWRLFKKFYLFIYFGHTEWLAGSEFPQQGQTWVLGSESPCRNPWTAREFLKTFLSLKVFITGRLSRGSLMWDAVAGEGLVWSQDFPKEPFWGKGRQLGNVKEVMELGRFRWPPCSYPGPL